VTEDKLPERNLKDDRLEQVTESGKLLIGISPDYAPFAFMEDSKDTTKISAADKETDTTKTSAADNTAQTDDTSTCAGSDVQLGEYIAKQLGVEPLFVEMEFDDCLKAAKEGTVDLVLLGMLPKNDRKASVDFTEEYYKPGKQVLLVTEEKQGREFLAKKKRGR
jgi:polar amino acid transport system substrate-binding protein